MRGTDVCNGGLARSARLRAVPARSTGSLARVPVTSRRRCGRVRSNAGYDSGRVRIGNIERRFA